MKLAEFRMEVRKERRHHEWRVSLGLWVGMGAGMVAFKGQALPNRLLVPALLGVVVVHGLIWVRGNFSRNERDAKRAYRDLDKAQALLPYDFNEPSQKKPWWPRWLHWLSKPDPPRYLKWLVEPAEGEKDYCWYGWLVDPPPLLEVLTTALLAATWIFINCYFGAHA